MKKCYGESAGTQAARKLASLGDRCQACPMTRTRFSLLPLFCSVFLASSAPAQTPPGSDTSELLSLTKKIDEQNAKIDLLSQQILKLEHEVGQMKVIPSATSVGVSSEEALSPPPAPAAGGSTHVVARGETLTSIAKMHKVGIDELQKFNHIENDRKLQIGQTLVIPGAQSPAPAATPSPNE